MKPTVMRGIEGPFMELKHTDWYVSGINVIDWYGGRDTRTTKRFRDLELYRRKFYSGEGSQREIRRRDFQL